MKKLLIITFTVLLAGLNSQASTLGDESSEYNKAQAAESEIGGLKQMRLKGSGRIIEKEITLSGKYSTIEVSRAVNVVMEDRTDNKVVISADDNVMEYVECKIEGGKLVAKINDKVGSVSNINVKIYLPSNNINYISTSSGGKVHIYHTIKTALLSIDSSSGSEVEITTAEIGKLALEASSAGNIKGSFKSESSADIAVSSAGKIDITLLCKEVKCGVSSGSKAELNGQAKTLHATASSAGDIEAKTFVAENVYASASSGGDIDVFAQKRLDATASSGSNIRYKGPVPSMAVSISTSSGGSVKQL